MISSFVTDSTRQLLTGLRTLIVLTVLLGIGYPVVVWGLGQAAFRDQAGGSMVAADGALLSAKRAGRDQVVVDGR